MKPTLLATFVLLIAAGCAQRSYEYDFSTVPDFQWNGKVTVTEVERGRIGPFLMLEKDWAVKHIKLGSQDGRVAIIDTNDYKGAPITGVGLPGQSGIPLTGTAGPSQLIGIVLLADPARVAEELRQAEDLKDRHAIELKGEAVLPIDVERPLVDHADEMSLAQWWAVAVQEAREVSVRYELPNENLHIITRGDPSAYGPAVMEVWTNDGKLLRKFERQQIPVSAFKSNGG